MSSGLLQRLAARAAGTAWTLRSDARLPFAAAALAPVQEAGPELSPATASDDSSASLHGWPAEAVPSIPALATLPSAMLPATPAAASATRPARSHDAKAEDAANAPVQAPPVPYAASTSTARAARSAAPDTSRPSESNTDAARARRLHDDTAALARPRFEAPMPLLPALPHGARHAMPSASDAQGLAAAALRAAPQGAGSETEVHIHIGRIDVTALHEAPKAKPRPRERAQPVSLDAYLAGRSKSR